jgi:hypothetical protein
MLSVKKILLLILLSTSFLALCPPTQAQIDALRSSAAAEQDPTARKVLNQRAAIMQNDLAGTSAPIVKSNPLINAPVTSTLPVSNSPKKTVPKKTKTGIGEQAKRLIQAAKNKMGIGKRATTGRK